MDLTQAPIVFLHIPKTAGQTVHNCLSGVVKAKRVSPIRVHTQTHSARDQYPPGYSLYSGHLDWCSLDHLPPARFVFTVLRDPGERIASFYFYLQRKAADLDAQARSLPNNLGLKRAAEWSLDDYFFGGDDTWQRFVRSHYDNFYCTYFATRRMLGWGAAQSMAPTELLMQAQAGLAALDRVYATTGLLEMALDFKRRFGLHLPLAERYDNTSGEPANALRWPRLLASFQTDLAADRLKRFIEHDHLLTKGIV